MTPMTSRKNRLWTPSPCSHTPFSKPQKLATRCDGRCDIPSSKPGLFAKEGPALKATKKCQISCGFRLLLAELHRSRCHIAQMRTLKL